MAANGAQYGVSTAHFYWIGAVPAMVFLGIVMMPFYYGSKVRSVPEYLRLRFDQPTHLFNALTFAVGLGAHRRRQPLRPGDRHRGAARLAALAGHPRVGAPSCSPYITLGGLSSAIYNEVLQFFVILAGLVPLVIVGLPPTAAGTA